MNTKYLARFAFGCITLLAVLVPTLAFAQDEVALPWFAITARPEVGGGAGSMTLTWDGIAGIVDHEEDASIQGVSYWGLAIEAYFMPTSGRHFIISAALPFGAGRGQFEKDAGVVIDGQDVSFNTWSLALGLGYQWYFGATRSTNLMLMGHLGGGMMRFAVDQDGETQTSDSLGASYADITIGSTHRFANGFLLGGTLAFAGERFGGTTDAGDFWTVDAEGGVQTVRLGLVLGYAVR